MRIRHIRKAQFAKTRTPASVAFALLGVAALGLASCSVSNQSGNRNLSTTTTQQTSDEARQTGLTTDARQTRTNRTTIALLVPLSRQGQTAEIAKGLKQAGELALFEYKDPNLQLVVKDTAGTPEGAKAAATAALDAGAQIIIGPLFAASVTSVAAVAKPRGVPIIAFSNDETVAGANTYLLSFQPRQEISRIVSYASAMGKRRFAGLIADDTYGKVLKREFQSAVAATGGRMIALETYPRGANGMLERSQKLFERISDQPADGEGNAAAQTAPT
ncbi:MAG: penicillin-binding protein activator, partial [Pseudomonadota bacterium]